MKPIHSNKEKETRSIIEPLSLFFEIIDQTIPVMRHSRYKGDFAPHLNETVGDILYEIKRIKFPIIRVKGQKKHFMNSLIELRWLDCPMVPLKILATTKERNKLCHWFAEI